MAIYLCIIESVQNGKISTKACIVRVKPEAGAFGRLKKPQEALDAREWRWVWEASMKRAKPSPYKTKARLGLSAMALSVIQV